jgi:hypothetical protein
MITTVAVIAASTIAARKRLLRSCATIDRAGRACDKLSL